MRSQPDYIVKIDGLATPDTREPGKQAGTMKGRPWIAVKWQCCSVYSRIYRNRVGTAYEGRCPKCASPVRASIGSSGTNKRFFNAG